MPFKYVVVNGLMKKIEVDSSGNQIGTTAQTSTSSSTPASTLADPNKALTFTSNFDDASKAAEAVGTSMAPSTITALNTVQSQEFLNKFGNSQVAGDAIYHLMNQIFTKIQAPIGLANKLLILQGFNINIKIDDSGSMSGERWNQAYQRLLEMMDILQVVPTGPVTLSFLDRSAKITISRYGKTPAQFYAEVSQWLGTQFRTAPGGGTPIYNNVKSMLRNSRGNTAHYIITDGVPTGYGNEREDTEREIRDVKNLILGRGNAQANPITLMCCSTNPLDTEWMHEVEEIACMPGYGQQAQAPGFVAALQNFDAERLEVLNDQGTRIPYSRSVWLICSLVAALFPNDLDALDQHAPLCKTILDDCFLGYKSTITQYTDYFENHPNAPYLFAEDFQAFVEVPITNQIPAVRDFENILAQKLNAAINRGDDTSEFVDLCDTEIQLLTQYRRSRPNVIFQHRQAFWGHYGDMDKQQLQNLRYQPVVSQHLWADYIAYSNLGSAWVAYLQGCNTFITEVTQRLAQSHQQQAQVQAAQYDQQPHAEGEEAPPPYNAAPDALAAAQYDSSFVRPTYYNQSRYIQPATTYNQSGSSPAMWQPPQQSAYQQPQYQGGGRQQYNPQYNEQRSSCCSIS